jgi:hypothetical protein
VYATVIGQDISSISAWVRRDGYELDLVFHRGLIDHRLNFGDSVEVQRANVRAMGVDEVQDDDFAVEVRKRNWPTLRVLQRELRCVLVHGLEVLLPTAKLGFKLLEGMCRCRRQRENA